MFRLNEIINIPTKAEDSTEKLNISIFNRIIVYTTYTNAHWTSVIAAVIILIIIIVVSVVDVTDAAGIAPGVFEFSRL